jgi:hypothetical protein
MGEMEEKTMSEHEKDHEPEGEALSEERTPEEQAELTRRTFLRRTAEVAAFALLGVPTLEAAVRKVAQRVAEIQGLDGLAREAAEYLAESGFGAAWAAAEPCPPHCPPPRDPSGGCLMGFVCTQEGQNPFTCQQTQHFSCTVYKYRCSPNEVECDPLPNGQGFHCGQPGEDGAGYLCPSVAAFNPMECADLNQVECEKTYECHRDENNQPQVSCEPPADYGPLIECVIQHPPVACGEPHVIVACTPQTGGYAWCPEVKECHGADPPAYNCEGSHIDFRCVKQFRCGTAQDPGDFICGPADASIVDFDCWGTFECGDPGNAVNDFSCQALHLFACSLAGGGLNPATFYCYNQDPNQIEFTCGAGGNLCGPHVGGYSADEPGDFSCRSTLPVGIGQGYGGFLCGESNFECKSVDDFECEGGANVAFNALCTAAHPFNGDTACADPTDDMGGVFKCTDGIHFQCSTEHPLHFTCTDPAQGGKFDCLPQQEYSQ